ncbi:fibronectin type III domain-containing protein [Chengkuizengella sp. SCS-71B]|uniref:fibronectin type III domain-containing protein n=1 Tax=Chengkuizengella sp. SCS-71B TaxID=3115290 RepID=UPI0032C22CCA
MTKTVTQYYLVVFYTGEYKGSNSYYDIVAAEYMPQNTNDIGRLTGTMQKAINYENWDFETTWSIEEGVSYPYLTGLSVPDKVRPLKTPVYVEMITTDSSIELIWDNVTNATGYQIEVNGEEIIEVLDPTYIQENLLANTQYYYRIRAISEEKKSEWSKIHSTITWNDDPVLVFENKKWIVDDELDQNFEIVLQGNALVDLYTAEFTLNYNPNIKYNGREFVQFV